MTAGKLAEVVAQLVARVADLEAERCECRSCGDRRRAAADGDRFARWMKLDPMPADERAAALQSMPRLERSQFLGDFTYERAVAFAEGMPRDAVASMVEYLPSLGMVGVRDRFIVARNPAEPWVRVQPNRAGFFAELSPVDLTVDQHEPPEGPRHARSRRLGVVVALGLGSLVARPTGQRARAERASDRPARGARGSPHLAQDARLADRERETRRRTAARRRGARADARRTPPPRDEAGVGVSGIRDRIRLRRHGRRTSPPTPLEAAAPVTPVADDPQCGTCHMRGAACACAAMTSAPSETPPEVPGARSPIPDEFWRAQPERSPHMQLGIHAMWGGGATRRWP